MTTTTANSAPGFCPMRTGQCEGRTGFSPSLKTNKASNTDQDVPPPRMAHHNAGHNAGTSQEAQPEFRAIRTRLDIVESQQLPRPFGLRFRHPQGQLSEAVAAVLLVQEHGRNLGHLECVLHEFGPKRFGLGQDADPAFHSRLHSHPQQDLTGVGGVIASEF